MGTKAGVSLGPELIQTMFALHQKIKDRIQVLPVNGHVGVQGNELADRMSILAIGEKTLDFVRYRDALDVKAILAMREG
jgi:ribonuclease HI